MIAATLGLSLLIGILLGLLGGGGSIMTVPILTYVAGMEAKSAIAAALFVVAVTSAAGLVPHARARRVMWRTGLVLAGSGMLGAYGAGLVAAFVPARALLIGFAVMMLAAAAGMLKPHREPPGPSRELALGTAVAVGFAIGAVTGLVGVGGGFLVVPALVMLGRVPTRRAVATSLLVVSSNAAAGFLGHLGHATIDWPLAIAVTTVAVVGAVIGGQLAGVLAPRLLRRGFGVLVAVVGVVILVQELA